METVAGSTVVTGRYLGLQFLRFVAASLVVLVHVSEAISLRVPRHESDGIWLAGGVGVDLFFVISGFVMAESTDRRGGTLVGSAAALAFLKKRIVRVVPLYWFFTLLKVVAVLAFPALALRTVVDFEHVTLSLLFIPSESPWGLLQPVLPVGWTLSFEMLFYLVFAASIALGVHRASFTLIALGGVFIAGLVFPQVDALRFFSSALLFEFVLGILVAGTFRRVQGSNLSQGFGWAWAGLVLGLGLIFLGSPDAPQFRLVTWGLGSALLVLAVAGLEQSSVCLPLFERTRVLGDMSYSTYLSHTFVVPLVVVLLCKFELYFVPTIYGVVLVAVLIGSLASWLWVEKPLIKGVGALLK